MHARVRFLRDFQAISPREESSSGAVPVRADGSARQADPVSNLFRDKILLKGDVSAQLGLFRVWRVVWCSTQSLRNYHLMTCLSLIPLSAHIFARCERSSSVSINGSGV